MALAIGDRDGLGRLETGWFKLNFDGSVYHDGSGSASIGGAIRGPASVAFAETTDHWSIGVRGGGPRGALIRGLRLVSLSPVSWRGWWLRATTVQLLRGDWRGDTDADPGRPARRDRHLARLLRRGWRAACLPGEQPQVADDVLCPRRTGIPESGRRHPPSPRRPTMTAAASRTTRMRYSDNQEGFLEMARSCTHKRRAVAVRPLVQRTWRQRSSPWPKSVHGHAAGSINSTDMANSSLSLLFV
ncbi:hypothetical protein OsJ_10504 [Oryza sativa Japonica Group]|uniref:Uncharacterized protein n=2 Tax=Oryza TaxID=4527 RepID=A3AH15_ORYSJ|nr:hypothetical protein OsJ_10504 [Oryza sativa Japonica Group]